MKVGRSSFEGDLVQEKKFGACGPNLSVIVQDPKVLTAPATRDSKNSCKQTKHFNKQFRQYMKSIYDRPEVLCEVYDSLTKWEMPLLACVLDMNNPGTKWPLISLL